MTEPEPSSGVGELVLTDLLGNLTGPETIVDVPRKGERKMIWKKFVEKIEKEMPLMGEIDYSVTEDDDNERD